MTAYRCQECSRTTAKYPGLCKTKGHAISKVKATERYFRCTKCRRHMRTIERIPRECAGCGAQAFERTTAYRGDGCGRAGREMPGQEVVASAEAFRAAVRKTATEERCGDDRVDQSLRGAYDTVV